MGPFTGGGGVGVYGFLLPHVVSYLSSYQYGICQMLEAKRNFPSLYLSLVNMVFKVFVLVLCQVTCKTIFYTGNVINLNNQCP